MSGFQSATGMFGSYLSNYGEFNRERSQDLFCFVCIVVDFPQFLHFVRFGCTLTIFRFVQVSLLLTLTTERLELYLMWNSLLYFLEITGYFRIRKND